jgi:DNA-binding response OmpR family regulator
MQHRRFHILVADEDSGSLHRSVDLLKQGDYVVAGAPTIEEVQWWLSGWPIDLVVAPSHFDGLTGLQLVLSARANQSDVLGLLLNPDQDAQVTADAARHGLHVATAPSDSPAFSTQVRGILSVVTRRPRWPRKEVSGAVPIRVGTSTGKLMDVSYGGLKFELPDEFVLRSPVELDFPRSDLRLSAEVVWSARGSDGVTCVFGASVGTEPSHAEQWRSFVDRVS